MLEAALVLSSLLHPDPSLFIFFPGSSALLHEPLATQTVAGGDDDFMSTLGQSTATNILEMMLEARPIMVKNTQNVYLDVSILLQVKPKSPCVYIKSDCVGGF